MQKLKTVIKSPYFSNTLVVYGILYLKFVRDSSVKLLPLTIRDISTSCPFVWIFMSSVAYIACFIGFDALDFIKLFI